MNRLIEWVIASPGLDLVGTATLNGGKFASVGLAVFAVLTAVIRGACGV